MADWFGRSSEALEKVQGTGNTLGVFTLALVGVEDSFDPDPLWDRRYGGRAEIAEGLTGERDFRLQAAIDGCRNSVFERDSAGRFREANPVFTDVVMWIPEARWRADAIRGGGHLGALQHTLSVLHKEKFARSLPKDRQPRYSVMADPRLADDSVVFQFGFGVFVPDGDDVIEAEIEWFKPGEPVQPLPPWVSWHEGAQKQRPVGIYRGQRSLLISGGNGGPVRPALWFGDRSGDVMLNLNADDAERVYPSIPAIRVADTTLGANPVSVEWRLDYGIGSESVCVRLVSVSESGNRVVAPKPVEQHEPTVLVAAVGSARDGEATEKTERVDSGEPLLSSQYSLQLAGLALFRIDPTRIPDLTQWVIWLDDFGWPVRESSMDDVDETSCLAIRSLSGSNQLEVRRVGAKRFQSIKKLPTDLESGAGGKLKLLPSPDPRRYLAMLMLNAGVPLPVSRTPLSLGRATTSEDAEPDLPIDLLDHPRSAQWAPGARNAGARLDAIELSRRHVRVRLLDGQLEVGMAKGNTPAFALDRAGLPLVEMEPKSQRVTTLDPGQHLLLGSYVFRFERDKVHTVPSTGGHPRLRDHR